VGKPSQGTEVRGPQLLAALGPLEKRSKEPLRVPPQTNVPFNECLQPRTESWRAFSFLAPFSVEKPLQGRKAVAEQKDSNDKNALEFLDYEISEISEEDLAPNSHVFDVSG
jgi:hypothetical protein